MRWSPSNSPVILKPVATPRMPADGISPPPSGSGVPTGKLKRKKVPRALAPPNPLKFPRPLHLRNLRSSLPPRKPKPPRNSPPPQMKPQPSKLPSTPNLLLQQHRQNQRVIRIGSVAAAAVEENRGPLVANLSVRQLRMKFRLSRLAARRNQCHLLPRKLRLQPVDLISPARPVFAVATVIPAFRRASRNWR